MYLEISGRQTGKTLRLINQIYADKEQYDVQILMGMNHHCLNQIKSNVIKNRKLKICLSFDALRAEIGINKNKRIRIYVDEFLYSTAFCNNFLSIIENFTTIVQNGYFSSSINSKYQDILKKLQSMNNGIINSMNVSFVSFN